MSWSFRNLAPTQIITTTTTTGARERTSERRVGSLDVVGKLDLEGLVAGLPCELGLLGLAVPHKADFLELPSHTTTTTQMSSPVRDGRRRGGLFAYRVEVLV